MRGRGKRRPGWWRSGKLSSARWLTPCSFHVVHGCSINATEDEPLLVSPFRSAAVPRLRKRASVRLLTVAFSTAPRVADDARQLQGAGRDARAGRAAVRTSCSHALTGASEGGRGIEGPHLLRRRRSGTRGSCVCVCLLPVRVRLFFFFFDASFRFAASSLLSCTPFGFLLVPSLRFLPLVNCFPSFCVLPILTLVLSLSSLCFLCFFPSFPRISNNTFARSSPPPHTLARFHCPSHCRALTSSPSSYALQDV